MYTALRATSLTLVRFLQARFQADSILAPFFGGVGGMAVSLNTPQEMADIPMEGLSVWLYRVVRDEESLNAPRRRIAPNQLARVPLPLRLHYLMTPITAANSAAGAETEQVILGKTLQALYDHSQLSGTLLQDDLSGTDVELTVRLETLGLDEISRVWEALDGSYQLSVSYEVSVVEIHSALEPERAESVVVALPEYGPIVTP